VFPVHGTDDANCPVQGVIDIGNTVRERGRTNLRTFIVPDHDHSLEFVSRAVSGSLPAGLKILFDQVERWPTAAFSTMVQEARDRLMNALVEAGGR
jgi:hypothetical protein